MCRKCSKKLKGGGFGDDGDQKLDKALRKALGGKGGKSLSRKSGAAVIEVACLDVCPKDAVVAVRAAAPWSWVIVPRGTPMTTVVKRLGLGERLPVPSTSG